MFTGLKINNLETELFETLQSTKFSLQKQREQHESFYKTFIIHSSQTQPQQLEASNIQLSLQSRYHKQMMAFPAKTERAVNQYFNRFQVFQQRFSILKNVRKMKQKIAKLKQRLTIDSDILNERVDERISTQSYLEMTNAIISLKSRFNQLKKLEVEIQREKQKLDQEIKETLEEDIEYDEIQNKQCFCLIF